MDRLSALDGLVVKLGLVGWTVEEYAQDRAVLSSSRTGKRVWLRLRADGAIEQGGDVQIDLSALAADVRRRRQVIHRYPLPVEPRVPAQTLAKDSPLVCPDCGTDLGRLARFCPECGASVGRSVAPSKAPLSPLDAIVAELVERDWNVAESSTDRVALVSNRSGRRIYLRTRRDGTIEQGGEVSLDLSRMAEEQSIDIAYATPVRPAAALRGMPTKGDFPEVEPRKSGSAASGCGVAILILVGAVVLLAVVGLIVAESSSDSNDGSSGSTQLAPAVGPWGAAGEAAFLATQGTYGGCGPTEPYCRCEMSEFEKRFPTYADYTTWLTLPSDSEDTAYLLRLSNECR